jgi:hypothetical protein
MILYNLIDNADGLNAVDSVKLGSRKPGINQATQNKAP